MTKIYYTELTPEKLKWILSSAKEQKTTRIELKAFPVDDNEKVKIVLNCYENFKRQASFSHVKSLSLEELQVQDVIESITSMVYASGVAGLRRACPARWGREAVKQSS